MDTQWFFLLFLLVSLAATWRAEAEPSAVTIRRG